MKKKIGKYIEPKKLQASVLGNLVAYCKLIKDRALKYVPKMVDYSGACYVCGGSSFSESIMCIYGVDYITCLNCGHLISTKRLSDKQLHQFYGDSAEYAKTYTDPIQLQYRLQHVAIPKIQYVMEQIGNNFKGEKSWLDVGCAIGDIVKAVGQYTDWNGVGLDISQESVSLGKKTFHVDLRKKLFVDFCKENPKKCFTVISFFGYLSLILNPMSEISLARKHIKDDGFIVIGEENAFSLSTLVQESYPSLTSRHIVPPNTVHQFTLKSMRYALQKNGFKLIAVWNFGLDFYEFLKNVCLRDKKFEKTPVYAFLLDHVNEFQGVVDKQMMGDYQIIIAKKI